MSIHSENVLRADWRYYGVARASATQARRFLALSGAPHLGARRDLRGSATAAVSSLFPAVVSPPMGSSGSKKTRKGAPRQHLAKVGTPAENNHTRHAAERDVAGNFGVRGKGWLYWGAVGVLVLIVVGSLLGWIFWF